MASLRSAMKKANALPADLVISSVEGAKSSGALTDKEIRRTVQDVLDMMPREIAVSLPVLSIKVVERLTKDGKVINAAGRYQVGGKVQISTSALKGFKGTERKQEMRRILSHELMHWVHTEAQGPAADAYRAAIRRHFAARTMGEKPETSPHGFNFLRDGWFDEYAGRVYDGEEANPMGFELPSKFFELWEYPENVTKYSDLNRPNGAGFRETFTLVNSIFDRRS